MSLAHGSPGFFDGDLFKPNQKPDHFAVLIGGHTELRHSGNISLAYQILLEEGYDRRDVFILSPREEEAPPYFPTATPTTIDAFRELFSLLKKLIEPHDTLLLYVTGHGRRVEADHYIHDGKGSYSKQILAESSLVLNDQEDIGKAEVLRLFETLSPKTTIAIFDICYWGMFSVKKWPSSVIITTALTEETSFGVTFPRAFWPAFRAIPNPTIAKTFRHALQHDKGAKTKQHSPKLQSKEVDPERLTLLGENRE
ncbi:MAG: hypothetical protein AB1540_04805 [Bdellovibrionota bacterium]